MPAIDALKTASKITLRKAGKATGDLVGNKIADKITKVSKVSKYTLLLANTTKNQ